MAAIGRFDTGDANGRADQTGWSAPLCGLDTGGWILVVLGILIGLWPELLGIL